MNVSILNNYINDSITFDNSVFVLYKFLSDDITINHNTSKTIKQIGEYINNTSVSSRQINITGYIIGESQEALQQEKARLLNIVNPLQDITIIAGNKQIIGKAKNGVKWATSWDNNNNYFVKFSLTFIAPSTLWEDIEFNIVNFTPWENKFKFPLSIPAGTGMIFGARVRNKFTSITNNSNVALGAIFKLTCLSEVVNPTIINVQTGEKLVLNITLQPTDQLTIDTGYISKNITLNGANGIKYFDFFNSTWLMLQAGDNTFTYSTTNGADNDLNIEIMYKNNYWGVYSE